MEIMLKALFFALESNVTRRETTKGAGRLSEADYAELELNNYSFIPSQESRSQTWQDRMLSHYNSELYRDYVLADMRYVEQRTMGLRWRTEEEVRLGKVWQ
jgi:hypothetical protein